MTSRREVLKWLVSAPALAAITWKGEQAERAAGHVRALAGEAAAYRPKFFTPHEWRTVSLLVDDVIPRDDRSGSATEAKVPEFIDFILADAESDGATRTAMRGGLAWLDLACLHQSGVQFANATEAQRHQLLDQIAWPRKARAEMSQGVAFFNDFRDLTATGFFSSAMGWQDLRYEGNVALKEWNGCPPPALDKLGVSDAMMDVRPAKR